MASKERQLLLKQSQEIARLRQSTHKVNLAQTGLICSLSETSPEWPTTVDVLLTVLALGAL